MTGTEAQDGPRDGIVLRVVGNNRKGGARKYCWLLNAHLAGIGQRTVTFIPRGALQARPCRRAMAGARGVIVIFDFVRADAPAKTALRPSRCSRR